MRSTKVALVLLTLVGACEHKNKSTDNANADKGGNNGTIVDKTAPPPNDPPPTNPPPTEPPPADPGAAPTAPAGGDDVRPPVAADLPEYLKDLPGKGNRLLAKFETSMGAINCELYPDKAPMTVANFVGLATGKKPWMNPKTGNVEKGKPFFDGLIFHRVITQFMIQGGDPLGRGTGGPGYQFGDETDNGLTMQPGTLAMANAGPGTNGSQFFITEIAPDWLNGKHTIFGRCREVELVKKMGVVPQNAANKPDNDITMKVMISKG